MLGYSTTDPHRASPQAGRVNDRRSLHRAATLHRVKSLSSVFQNKEGLFWRAILCMPIQHPALPVAARARLPTLVVGGRCACLCCLLQVLNIGRGKVIFFLSSLYLRLDLAPHLPLP